jgi:hypothetical protein
LQDPGDPHRRAVLGNPAYRDRARRMRDDIHAPPAAAEALERLVH